MDDFDNEGRKVCCKVSLYKKCQRQSCSAFNCLSSGINILAGGPPFPPEILQSETGFPSRHQLKSYVTSKSRLKLAARAVLSADAGLLVGCLLVCLSLCLFVTLLNVRDCVPDFAMKALWSTETILMTLDGEGL